MLYIHGKSYIYVLTKKLSRAQIIVQLLSTFVNELITFLDIDECGDNSTNDCDQMCTNTAGSYLCRCGGGFTLDQDGKRCNGMLVYQCRV